MLELEILTPEGQIFKGTVDAIQLPGSAEMGSLEILKDHAPLISSLVAGEIQTRTGNQTETYKLQSGFVEVLNNKVSVMVEGAQD